MALLSELVATCEAERLDKGPTLNMFARRLREAGRITQAGRGRGAAHMTYLDAARFLIACAATDSPEQAVDAEYVFSNLKRSDELPADADFPLVLAEFPTLDLGVAEALRLIGEGKIKAVAERRWREKFPDSVTPSPMHLWLRVDRGGGGANLRVLDGQYIYRHPALAALITSTNDGTLRDVSKVATEAFDRETYRFRTGKNLSAELDGKLLRAVAMLIAGDRA